MGTPHPRPDIVQPEDISVRHIALTQGQIAVVDAHLYDWLTEKSWCARWSKYTKSFYVLRGEKGKTVLMHRQIVGLEAGDKREVDHQNHDTLDFRGTNLRLASHGQNVTNRRLFSGSKSGHKGITWSPSQKKWVARIRVNKKLIYLGANDDPKALVPLYEAAAAEHHGEFACQK